MKLPKHPFWQALLISAVYCLLALMIFLFQLDNYFSPLAMVALPIATFMFLFSITMCGWLDPGLISIDSPLYVACNENIQFILACIGFSLIVAAVWWLLIKLIKLIRKK